MVAIRKRSTANFPKNEHFLTPDTHMYVSRRKKWSFFGKFGLLCFIVIIVLRVSPFLYYQRNDCLFMFKVADVISSWNHDIILYCRNQKSVSGIQTVHITNCLHMSKGIWEQIPTAYHIFNVVFPYMVSENPYFVSGDMLMSWLIRIDLYWIIDSLKNKSCESSTRNLIDSWKSRRYLVGIILPARMENWCLAITCRVDYMPGCWCRDCYLNM